MWDAVEKQLADNRNGERHVRTAAHPSLLAGKLFDPDGEPMIATHANKGTRRYRYYVSRSLHSGQGGTDANAMRLPALEVEHIVRQEFAATLRDPSRLVALLASSAKGRQLDRDLIDKAATLASDMTTASMLSAIILRVDIEAEAVRITIDVRTLAHHLGLSDSYQAEPTTITAAVKLKRSGRALRMIMPGGQRPVPKIDDTLVNAIAIAHRWWADLLADPTLTLEDLASREGVNSSLMTRTLRLAFLDPMIVEQICVGKAPAKLSFETLRHPESMPALWAHQRAVHSIAIDG